MDLEGTVEARDYLTHIEERLGVPHIWGISPVVVVIKTRTGGRGHDETDWMMGTGRVLPSLLYSRIWTLTRWPRKTSYWLLILLQQLYALPSASLGASIKRSRSRSIRSIGISHPQYDPPPLPI